MLLLEADGKKLLRMAGIDTPDGVLVRPGAAVLPALPGAGPWLAKAQVPVGGRGKAGGVKQVDSVQALPAILRRIFDAPIKGHIPKAVLVETAQRGAELYLALIVDAASGGVRVLFSPSGGVDIEAHPNAQGRVEALVPLESAALRTAVHAIAREMGPHGQAMRELGERLVDLFLRQGLLLAEINPLFAVPGGRLVAGDAKIVIDMNAVTPGEVLGRIIEDGADLYPDAWRKLTEDFDFVEIDPNGQVALITTGAGLSMMLLDELVLRGMSVYNFCDIRTGQMRGSPDRLIRTLDWIGSAPGVKQVLINVFAGITDLAEFSGLILQALAARPSFHIPIVARLVGNGEDQARKTLEGSDCDITVEDDLERCVDLLSARLGGADA